MRRGSRKDSEELLDEVLVRGSFWRGKRERDWWIVLEEQDDKRGGRSEGSGVAARCLPCLWVYAVLRTDRRNLELKSVVVMR